MRPSGGRGLSADPSSRTLADPEELGVDRLAPRTEANRPSSYKEWRPRTALHPRPKGIIDSVLRGMMGNLHRHVLCERGKPLGDRLPVRVLDVCHLEYLEPGHLQQNRRREVILLGFRILSGERLSRMEGGQLGLSNMLKGVLPRPPPGVVFVSNAFLFLRGFVPVHLQVDSPKVVLQSSSSSRSLHPMTDQSPSASTWENLR